MNKISLIIFSTFLISLIALIGVLILAVNKKIVNKILLWLVGLSTGALMGGAFIHLIPEALEKSQSTDINIFNWILISFIIFFLIEKVLHWRHCHKQHCHVHTFGTMNLFGDAVHNFIDGLIIAAAFMTDNKLGIATTLAVAFHEIPQEISDYGVLLYAGFSRKKALYYNFIVALTVVAGGLVGYYLYENIQNLEIYLLAIAAGGFIYISASDLLPEIRNQKELGKSISAFLFFITGIILMYLLTFIK